MTVTGASGFVGSAVCRHLHALGWNVRGVVRRPLENAGWDVLRGDLRDDTIVKEAVHDTDLVVHAAGLAHIPLHRQIARDFYVQNVESTLRLANAAADQHVPLIFVSSSAAETAHGPYGESKRIAEERLRELGTSRELHWAVLRPALLFGECDPGNFLRLIRIAAQRKLVYLDGGRARKSLTYVGNVGPAIAALVAQRLPQGRCYSLADRRPYTVREIVEEICRQLGVPDPRLSLPAPVACALGRIGSAAAAVGLPSPLRLDVVETLMRDAVVDTTALEEETGFLPPISFPEGVRRTIVWWKEQRIVS